MITFKKINLNRPYYFVSDMINIKSFCSLEHDGKYQ